jgi:hypothetical protein
LSNTVVWLFGRGLSVGCGLTWEVPQEWSDLPRNEKIDRITRSLRHEMDSPKINTSCIDQLLEFLAARTKHGWRHFFVTTNWDYLLQREIDKLSLSTRPRWLYSGMVHHLNGTVEDLPDNTNRSPFLLQEDTADARTGTVEADVVFSKMIWERTFVVVGMSFECATDQFLLRSLNRVQDDLPIGESDWIVINPDRPALDSASDQIGLALPAARVVRVCKKFEEWLETQCLELGANGIIV